MNPIALFLISVALFTFVGGQLLLKPAMELSGTRPLLNRKFLGCFSGGIFLMTVSFFITLGLLQRFDLSYLYPFHGLSVIIISLASAVFLKEKLNFQLTLGALLISAGIILVSTS